MTNTVIKIEGLGKKYLLAHKSPQRNYQDRKSVV